MKRFARLALAAFLFAQAALAVAACQMAERSAAQAIASASAATSEPCHQQDEDSAALCVAHCVTESQSLEKPFGKLPAPATAPVAVYFMAPPSALVRSPVDARLALAGPPRRILYRTLLI
jgi:hypothetical protein